MDHIDIRKDSYFDSVFLMAASAELAKIEGLEAGHLVLATPANLQLLQEQGFDPAALRELGPTDLVIALRAADSALLEQARGRVDALLAAEATAEAAGSPGGARPVGLDGGLRALPDANLALVSVPGPYAAHEARRALERGLHVMIFSDNVSLEDEIRLKQRAAELGLLVMGPDCGTALIQGKPLGFANALRSGTVGLVGASGTGLQEIACRIHNQGSGVTHILGTGGRDLKAEVGARTALAALDLLAADPETRVVVVVSKPPARQVAERVMDRLERMDRPAVVCFLGDDTLQERDGVQVASSLDEAAWMAHCLAAGQSISTTQPYEPVAQDVSPWVDAMTGAQRYVHGLYTGGTLAGEALLVLREGLGEVHTNLEPGGPPAGTPGHQVLDLGDDAYTRGRPHPMIDPAPRSELIAELGARPETAVVLLDVVLGYGSHPDPARSAAEAAVQARSHNPTLAVVASVTGTDLDPQDRRRQQQTLLDAGVHVTSSNKSAAALTARIAGALEVRK